MDKIGKLMLLVICFAAINLVYGQKTKTTENGVNYLEHKAGAGETLLSVARKYKVDILDITRLNPALNPVMKAGDILKIPGSGTESAAVDAEKMTGQVTMRHTVRKKETLYKISRQYGVSVETLREYNPGITTLKKGDILIIPQGQGAPLTGKPATGKSEPVQVTKITHWVQQGETLYSISQKYGQSVASILEMNPSAKELKAGMRLTIMKGQDTSVMTAPSSTAFARHTVEKGETLFSVSRKYHITPEKLVEANPSLNTAFRPGEVIRIPAGEGKPEPTPSPEKQPGIPHIVRKGETLYGISQQYKVPMTEILKYNPFLNNQLPRAGDTLLIVVGSENTRIKQKETEKADSGESVTIPRRVTTGKCQAYDYLRGKNQVLKVALLVPVFLEANRGLNKTVSAGDEVEATTDTIATDEMGMPLNNSPLESGINFYGSSENFIHFYEGVLLAVDTLQETGMKIELNVFDTEQKASKVKSLVTSGKLDRMDLIIGPVYPSEQKELAEFSSKNHIPVVSPLSASDEVTRSNPWFFQVNPPREFLWRKTREYVASDQRNSRILVLQTSSSESLAEDELKELKLEFDKQGAPGFKTDVRVCNFKKEGYTGLRDALVKDRKNVIVIPSPNEAEVSVVVSNIQSLSGEFDITLIGTTRFPQFESVNPEQFHYGQMEFLTPYWADYNRQYARSFVYNFRDNFKTEPNQFSIQGYDITCFFATAITNFGGDMPECVNNTKCELVQGNYYFEKLASGGNVNGGLSVVQYTPDFRIVRKMSFGGDHLLQH